MIRVCFLYSSISLRVKTYLNTHFSASDGISFYFPTSENKDEMLPQVQQADILIGWEISPELLIEAHHLQLFITPYTGVTHLLRTIHSVCAKLRRMPWFTLVNTHAQATIIAQHAVALLFSTLNQIVVHHNSMKEGVWIPGGEGVEESFPTFPISHRKIGLLGYGHINQKIHHMLAGFDVEFFILKKHPEVIQTFFPPLPVPAHVFGPNDLNSFLQNIDTLIIAVPLTLETKNMIQAKDLENLMPNFVLINVGRADVIEEAVLFNALQTKTIARAAIDVWYQYNPTADSQGRKYPFSHTFHQLDNVILSPHRADSPFDDLARWDEIIVNIRKYMKKETNYLNRVDFSHGY